MTVRQAKGAPTRRPLTRERILDVAVDLIEHGTAALSMRRLGAALDVEGMAIYHHFDGRDELLSAIADRLLEPLGSLEFNGDWREACEMVATQLREIAVERPATFQLVGLRPLPVGALAFVERLLAKLIAAGFDAESALAIYRATVSYARGYALAEATGFTVDAAGSAGLERLQNLSSTDFPILAGRAAQLTTLDADDAFRLGLRALLTGLDDPPGDSP